MHKGSEREKDSRGLVGSGVHRPAADSGCSHAEISRFKRSRKNCRKTGGVRGGMATDCAKSCLKRIER